MRQWRRDGAERRTKVGFGRGASVGAAAVGKKECLGTKQC